MDDETKRFLSQSPEPPPFIERKPFPKINMRQLFPQPNKRQPRYRLLARPVALLGLVVAIFVVNLSRIGRSPPNHHNSKLLSSSSSTFSSEATSVTKSWKWRTKVPRATPSFTNPNHRSSSKRSSNATVMGFATGYELHVYKRFVGSLRNTGFQGHIILAVAPDILLATEQYLQSRQVEIHKVKFEPCTNGMFTAEDEAKDAHDAEIRRCVAPFTDLKARWGRFPFLREKLKECAGCTGPVLIADVRDAFFQRDPFGSGHPQVEGLQVFEEFGTMTTKHWLVEWPVRECKGVVYDKPMLCSGTTVGTRQAMIDYLDAMHEEMKLWMNDKKCHFKINGDDQSIHNYLYYSGKLPFAKAIVNRHGIVHTIGAQGSLIREAHVKQMKKYGQEEGFKPFDGATEDYKQWLGEGFGLTDKDGFIIDFDFKRSAVVHQYDRFGPPLDTWLRQHSGLIDKP